MKIVIFGGSGFLGQAICTQLIKSEKNEVVIISRSTEPEIVPAGVTWVQSDIKSDVKWQVALENAAWVINCIGILLPSKQQSYHDGIVMPAQIIINYLISLPQQERPKLMYISAKKVPFFLSGYRKAKQQVERLMQILPASDQMIVYPPMMYGKARPSSVVMALMMNTAALLPGIDKLMVDYVPIKREAMAEEIVNRIDLK